ncbi:MAG: efflux RND transporter periplasmic adaptor subunit [Ktedonobacteraceae bacterium]
MSQEQGSTTSTTDQIFTQPPSHQLLNLPVFNEHGAADDAYGGSLTPWWRRRKGISIIVVILLVVLLGGFVFNVTHRRPRVTYQSQQVTQGNLTITVSATGPVQSGTYNLIFSGQGGKIDAIAVKIGQKVTQGQVLAQLDTTLLQDAVNQAQTAVSNAQAALNTATASAGSSQGQSNANVNAAQTALNDAKTNQSQVQAQSQTNIDSAQTALTNAQTNLTQVTNTANAQIQSANDTYTTIKGANQQCPTPLTPTCQQALDAFNQSVAQANTSIATAQAQVNTAQATLAQAKANGATNNTAAQNQVNAAQSQLNTARAGISVSGNSGQGQITTAQSQLNSAQAQLVQAQDNLNNATLTAPHDGTVTIINGTVGGTPGASATGSTAGTTAGGAFIQIVDLSALQVQANVNEADTAHLQVGETASFTVDAYSSQQFTGTVSAIPPIGQLISNVVTYPVSIEVDPQSLKGAHLLPSMTANVTINAIQHTNVLQIPVNAVNFARLASSGISTSSAPQLISSRDATSALNQARQMLNKLEASTPELVSEGPIPAFVIEKSGQQFVVKAVVLGLTDGSSYEVLQGLSLGDTFIAGTNSAGA